MFRLDGRVVLVIGGTGGIGSMVCRACAAQGAAVALVYRQSEAAAAALTAELAAAGARCLAVRADATRPETLVPAVQAVLDRLGAIDVLVCMQGSGHHMEPFHAQAEAEMRRIVEQEFWSVIHVTRAVLPHMLDRGGRCIAVGSDAGKVGTSLQAVSSAARGALIALYKSLAREYGARGVLFNVVCAGPTDTAAWRSRVAGGGLSANILTSMARGIPLKRIAQPEEVAAAVVFLATAEAGFVTGQALSVTGGLTMC